MFHVLKMFLKNGWLLYKIGALADSIKNWFVLTYTLQVRTLLFITLNLDVYIADILKSNHAW